MKDIRRHLGGIPARFAGQARIDGVVYGTLDGQFVRGTIGQPTSTVITVYKPNTDGTWVATQFKVTVYDVGFIQQSKSPLPIGTLIKARRYFGRYYYDGAGIC